jgi:SpoVK/Ycf46/Vps4 family AAA+-type ATPase
MNKKPIFLCKDISNNHFFNLKLNNIQKMCDKFFVQNPSINKNNDLNNNVNTFSMKIKKLLDDLQNERNKMHNKYLQLEDKKTTNKFQFDNYLTHINKKYDKIYNPYSLKTENPFSNLHYTPAKFKPPRPLKLKIEKVNINVSIENVQDILDLIEKYPIKLDVQYNINMQALHNIKLPLIRLNKMIGMQHLKQNIVDQILYFSQNLHQNQNNQSIDFMHTVIYGPPGTGKTEIANIIGHIFSNLGILKNKIFKKATRSDLIAGYLGQTAIKTTDLVKSCLGGCLFIDEAYALGNSEKRDSFAKECIDTLCEALSFHKNELMVIIAGYEKDLKDCFFAYNSGLESRFTWRFNTDDYTPSELNLIFQKKVESIQWILKDKIKDSWFEKHKDYFKYYGRDMETLLAKTKIAHGRRVFCLPEEDKKKITLKDLNKGFDMFLKNDEVKNRKKDDILSHLYL